MNRYFNNLVAALLLVGLPLAGLAQEKKDLVQTEVVAVTPPSTSSNDTGNEDPHSNKTQAPSATSECGLCRWFELSKGTISFRYRTTTDTIPIRNVNQLQHREILAGRFKFDAQGKYTINAHASSGYFFNWAYAGTGWGGGFQENFVKARQKLPFIPQTVVDNAPNSDGGNFWIRHLYFEAKPGAGLEFQYGSLPILRGENSETTTFDDDGYVAGGRISIKRPDKLFFNEISVTYAYLGYTYRRDSAGKIEFIDDVFRPNFFRRWKHLGNSNYHQFLVSKEVGDRLAFSTDYTFHERIDYMHQGVRIKTPELKVLDWVRLEAYQRIGTNVVNTYFLLGLPIFAGKVTIPGKFGYSVHGEKKLHDRFTVSGGFNEIDYNLNQSDAYYNLFGFTLNGDQMGLGKRFYFRTNTKLIDSLTLSTLMAKAFDIPVAQPLFNKTHINVAITWDFLKILKKTDRF